MTYSEIQNSARPVDVLNKGVHDAMPGGPLASASLDAVRQGAGNLLKATEDLIGKGTLAAVHLFEDSVGAVAGAAAAKAADSAVRAADTAKAAGDKPVFPALPSDNTDPDAEAKAIAKIVEKDGDFHSGMKRDQVADDLKKATADGTLDKLVDKINAQLEKDGSDYRLKATKSTQTDEYTEDVGNSAVAPGKKLVDNPRSVVEVVNRKTGQAEDRIESYSQKEEKGYIPGRKYDPFGLK